MNNHQCARKSAANIVLFLGTWFTLINRKRLNQDNNNEKDGDDINSTIC